MKKKMTVNTKVYVKIIIALFVLSLLVFVVFGYMIIQCQKELAENYSLRYDSFTLADELRHSSDNLTKFIRMYASTGDIYYKELYFEVLDIRNGVLARPKNYEQIYWDLMLPNREHSDTTGEMISLADMMKESGFTEEELALLQEAEYESNQLVEIELMAMRAIENNLLEEDLLLMQNGETNEEFARRILNDDAYIEAKAKIKEPISQFFIMFNERTEESVIESNRRSSTCLIIFIISISTIFILMGIYIKKAFSGFQENEAILEKTVAIRTSELTEKNRILTEAKNNLVQAEKMASLGNLVAGVAHEIKTPIGIGVTMSSSIADETYKIKRLFDSGNLTKDNLEQYFEMVTNSSDLMVSNMARANALINSFKQIAVDQSSNEMRRIDLEEYINEILLSLHSKFKNTKYEITVNSHDKIHTYTYPGAIYQIMTNLILNTLKHGFVDRDDGRITIDLQENANEITIRYQDDGVGIREEHIKKIFEPFFTTKRGSGGSGLGLNIVYNLVVHKLKGSIEVDSVINEGVLFTIKFPKLEE